MHNIGLAAYYLFKTNYTANMKLLTTAMLAIALFTNSSKSFASHLPETGFQLHLFN